MRGAEIHKLIWTGDDESGYAGNVNGVRLYEVDALLCASPPNSKTAERKYLYFPKRLDTGGYQHFAVLFKDPPNPKTAAEAKAQCETDYAGAGAAAFHAVVSEAIALVKAAGYRVTKPRISKSNGKDRVGPTFVAEFADGTVTRMSTFTSLENLDWGRGERLSQAAYQSRWRARYRKQTGKTYLADPIAPVPPTIIAARFEQDGKMLAQRTNGNAS